MKYLIINADDYGWSRGIVDGIIELYEAGLVTSTSVMVTMPAWEYGLEKLRTHPGLGPGIHLSIFDGTPVLPPQSIPTIIDRQTGQFIRLETLMQKPSLVDPADIGREYRAQIERFLQSGLVPTHIDNHCFQIYQRKAWFDMVLRLAREYRLPMRSPFGRNLAAQAKAVAKTAGIPWPALHLAGLIRRRQQRRHGVITPHNFIGDFSMIGRSADYCLETLAALPSGITELLTHPGYDGGWKEIEQKVWQDERIKSFLNTSSDIRLVSYAIFREM